MLVRTWIRRAFTDAFALIGAFALVGFFVAVLDKNWFEAVIALAVVGSTWWPAFRLNRSPRSRAFVTGHVVLFEAPMSGVTLSDTPPLTIRGPRDAIERFIPRTEFNELFGGWAIWAAPARPIIEMPGEALGVWGRRMCGRFRRILRERGAVLEVRYEQGPQQRLSQLVRERSYF